MNKAPIIGCFTVLRAYMLSQKTYPSHASDAAGHVLDTLSATHIRNYVQKKAPGYGCFLLYVICFLAEASFLGAGATYAHEAVWKCFKAFYRDFFAAANTFAVFTGVNAFQSVVYHLEALGIL